MSREAPKPADFTWDGVTGYAHVLHEPSLLTLRHHVNAVMVRLLLEHGARVEGDAKHAALEEKHAALQSKHEGLIALYTDLVNKHNALGEKYDRLEGKERHGHAQGEGGVVYSRGYVGVG
jgi:hypothetical protein